MVRCLIRDGATTLAPVSESSSLNSFTASFWGTFINNSHDLPTLYACKKKVSPAETLRCTSNPGCPSSNSRIINFSLEPICGVDGSRIGEPDEVYFTLSA
jgi:hypothetical protein